MLYGRAGVRTWHHAYMSSAPLCENVVVRSTPSVPAARSSHQDNVRLDHGLAAHTLLRALDGLLSDVSSLWLDSLLLYRPRVSPFRDLVASWGSSQWLALEGFEPWVPDPLTGEGEEPIAALVDLVQGLDPMPQGHGPARPHLYRDDETAAGPLDALGSGAR